MSNYIFKSERLGFRNWIDSDKSKMAAISSNPKVMEFFPSIQDYKHTEGFIKRMQLHFKEKGYCYFAVEKLENKGFIGFIGLLTVTFESDFTPCIDIGWRLAPEAWGYGYATEGAKSCIEYGLNALGLNSIMAICPIINVKSERVMQKIGMQKVKEFDHPLLEDCEHLRKCALYQIHKDN